MKCDLHVHTSYSYDGLSSPREMVAAAISKGIDCIAVCDHGEIEGAIKAKKYGANKSILIIPGIEVKTKEGDILGLNIKQIIPNWLSAKETIKRIKKEGGLAIIPHPFAWFCSFRGNLKDLLGEIDGIEVLNSSIFGPGNKKALGFAKKHNLPFTAGSDAHFPNFIGQAYLEIPGDNLSVAEVLNAIKNKAGRIEGEEAEFFEKIIDHSKRNLAKIRL
ncbi:MAG: CehA/McbA family metallohydrolase [Candidatus Paceibacterales bacterium]